MISAAIVHEVKHLLAQGSLSQREIAHIAGIGRSTVANIAAGRWVDRADRPAAGEVPFPRPSGPPTRCPTCGGRVYLPCLLCHVRVLKGRQARRAVEARRASA